MHIWRVFKIAIELYHLPSEQIGEQIKELRRLIAHEHVYYYDFKTNVVSQHLIPSLIHRNIVFADMLEVIENVILFCI